MMTWQSDLTSRIEKADNAVSALREWAKREKFNNDEMDDFYRFLEDLFDCALSLTEGYTPDEAELYLEDLDDVEDRFEESFDIADKLDEFHFQTSQKVGEDEAIILLKRLNQEHKTLTSNARNYLADTMELIRVLVEQTE